MNDVREIVEATQQLTAAHLLDAIRRGDIETPSPWLNTEEAARYCGLTKRGMEDLRYADEGPRYVRAGHRIVRYHIDWLDDWLKSKEVRPETKG